MASGVRIPSTKEELRKYIVEYYPNANINSIFNKYKTAITRTTRRVPTEKTVVSKIYKTYLNSRRPVRINNDLFMNAINYAGPNDPAGPAVRSGGGKRKCKTRKLTHVKY